MDTVIVVPRKLLAKQFVGCNLLGRQGRWKVVIRVEKEWIVQAGGYLSGDHQNVGRQGDDEGDHINLTCDSVRNAFNNTGVWY